MTRIRIAFVLCLATALHACSEAPAPNVTPAKQAAPDFGGYWHKESRDADVAIPGEPAPVGRLTNFVGDPKAPILKPWAAEIVKKKGDSVLAGNPIPTPQESCLPHGVPYVTHAPYPMEVVQSEDEIIFIYEFNHQFRIIPLNAQHQTDPSPSWYGDSVGRWEGDTLVIETIAQNDKTTLDSYGTPHTANMRVTERYRLIDEGKTLELIYTIDDPEAFNMPWRARTTYFRYKGSLQEMNCAENSVAFAPPMAE
jgi:hypothetical protein